MRKHMRSSEEYKQSDDILYRHFGGLNHNGLDSMSVQVIDRVSSSENLLSKEGQWAYKLRTLSPHGLNEDDFFFSQNTKSRKRA